MLTKVMGRTAAIGSAVSLFATKVAIAADTSEISKGVQSTGVSTSGGLKDVFSKVVNILFFIIGALAVIMLIIGGIMYVTSAGDSKRVESAKNTILYAIIGIVIAAVAGFIVNFILTSLK